MKYRPVYPNKGFNNLNEAREWVSGFVHWYNHQHLHSGINFITPYQRHHGLVIDIMQKRIETYKKAKEANPERWSGKIRDWSLPEYVTLNPMKEEELRYISTSKVLNYYSRCLTYKEFFILNTTTCLTNTAKVMVK